MRKNAKLIISIIIIVILGIVIYRIYFYPAPSLEKVLLESDFAELKPPTTLVGPGTITLIEDEDIGIIKVICPCTSAFGNKVQQKWIESHSTNIELTQKLSGEFNINLSFLNELSKTTSEVVKDISLKLSNVKILELPDDAVFELLNDRSTFCTRAINNRKNAGQRVTMVKRAIQADAEYIVNLSDGLEEDSKMELLDSISLQLSGKSLIKQGNKIIGKQLFWGVDDDIVLGGLQPGEPPSTGTLTRERSTNPKESYKVEYEQVSYNVKPLKQPSLMSCWATVYTMMESWRLGEELNISKVISDLGNPWEQQYEKDVGLPFHQVQAFLLDAGLEYKPPASYIPEVFEELLKEYGPVWMISGDGFSSHAKLLIGIYGDNKGDTSTLEFIDPADGKVQRLKFLDFIKEYEKEARFLNEKRPDVPLRIQIIHYSKKKPF